MPTQTVFHGTRKESTDLMKAIASNCECVYGVMGVRTSTCAAHTMLVGDQKAMDGLLFYRRIRACLQREEMTGD